MRIRKSGKPRPSVRPAVRRVDPAIGSLFSIFLYFDGLQLPCLICSYERVRAVQKTGEKTRDMWHKADWDKVAQNPESIQLPREDWILGHNAEKHAEDVFDEVVKQFV